MKLIVSYTYSMDGQQRWDMRVIEVADDSALTPGEHAYVFVRNSISLNAVLLNVFLAPSLPVTRRLL